MDKACTEAKRKELPKQFLSPKKPQSAFPQIGETLSMMLFALCACISIIAVFAICFFLFGNAVPAIRQIGLFDFLTGTEWKPSKEVFGIFPMILGSIYVTAGALLVGVPIGVLTAVFLVRYCPPALYRVIKPAVDLLAAIPSVIYGFFGLVFLVPSVMQIFHTNGKGILTASVLLGLMILPTVINTTESSLAAVPQSYYEGSLSLGATVEGSMFRVMFPAARSGILSGIILGLGRAIGETMAVVMVCGNQPWIPTSVTAGARTLTSNIVLEMAYATDLHRDALIASAVVLFVLILLINLCISALTRKGVKA